MLHFIKYIFIFWQSSFKALCTRLLIRVININTNINKNYNKQQQAKTNTLITLMTQIYTSVS